MARPRLTCFLTNAWVVTLLVGMATASCHGSVREYNMRAVDASNLRQITQASLIFSADHDGRLPEAINVHDYARILAEHAGLDVADMWISRIDPAHDEEPLSTVLSASETRPRELHPAFKKLKPSVAVVLGRIRTDMPATTPIAWTRGLQPDGTWAKHSPYGTTGGYIAFLNGNASFYKNLNQQDGGLVRYDGKGTTSNILEALPPGCRVGEYVPTPAEQEAWSHVTREFRKVELRARYAPFVILAALWLPFIGISVLRFRKRQPGAVTVLLWPLLFMFIWAVIMPMC